MRATLLLVPALLLVGILYLAPLGRLAALSFGESGFSLDAYGTLFSAWSYDSIMLRTFRISLIVVLACAVLGYPIAYVLAFATPRRRALLSLMVLLPFWTSVLVRNFAWIYLLRRDGVFSNAVGTQSSSGEPAILLYNEIGVVIGMVNTLLPFMVFPIFLAISSQERALREAAASLGATPARVFFTVTLPLSRHGIFAGALLVFATAVGFFITPALLGGGRVQMAAMFLTQQVEEYLNWPLAAAAGIILLLVVLLVAALYRRIIGFRMLGDGHALG
jgi:putative spermidine/putrescine transport system permease protein